MRVLFSLVALGLVVTGCGGGGGDSVPPPSVQVTATNPSAALGALLRTPKSYQLVGTAANGSAITATMTVAQAQTSTYQGQTFDLRQLTTAVTVGGATSTSGATYWLYPNTTKLAFVGLTGNECEALSSVTDLPTAASIGSVGQYASGKRYPGCQKPSDSSFIPLGSITYTWAFKSVAGTPLVCIQEALDSFFGSSQETCIQVTDAAGTIGAKLRVTVVDANKTTTVLATP